MDRSNLVFSFHMNCKINLILTVNYPKNPIVMHQFIPKTFCSTISVRLPNTAALSASFVFHFLRLKLESFIIFLALEKYIWPLRNYQRLLLNRLRKLIVVVYCKLNQIVVYIFQYVFVWSLVIKMDVVPNVTLVIRNSTILGSFLFICGGVSYHKNR